MTRIIEVPEASEKSRSEPAEAVLPLVYEELRRLAASRIANESGTQTLQPTALVHEAWLRLNGTGHSQWQNPGHFFAGAAEAMRRILIEHARRRAALKRGAGCKHLDITQVEPVAHAPDDRLLAVNEALTQLERTDSAKAPLSF